MGNNLSEPSDQRINSSVLRSTKGTYSIESELGRGGMGEVYKARFKSNSDGSTIEVALKKMKFDNSSYNLCQREIELMSKITASETSTNNVKMLDGFASNLETKTLCISMEYCEKGDLAGKIEKNKNNNQEFDKKLIYQYMFDIANGIDELHIKHKIVHRDIKPQNILIAYDQPAIGGSKRDVLKISDYGIAKIVDIVVKTSVATKTLIMTPPYASPEQLSRHACDTSADIWAIGLIFYELCSCPLNFYSVVDKIREKVRQGSALSLPKRFPPEDNIWLNEMVKQNPRERAKSGRVYSIARGRIISKASSNQ